MLGFNDSHLGTSFVWVLSRVFYLPYIRPDDSQQLSLFLQARSVLSAAVRLNIVGPYAAQKVLLHDVRQLVEVAFEAHKLANVDDDEGDDVDDIGPATTWPLIELLSSRHDMLHTRIFNS